MRADLYMDDLDEEKRAELRAKRLEAKKEMERERRKAVKAAYKRLKDSKSKKSDVSISAIIWLNVTMLQLLKGIFYFSVLVNHYNVCCLPLFSLKSLFQKFFNNLL